MPLVIKCKYQGRSQLDPGRINYSNTSIVYLFIVLTCAPANVYSLKVKSKQRLYRPACSSIALLPVVAATTRSSQKHGLDRFCCPSHTIGIIVSNTQYAPSAQQAKHNLQHFNEQTDLAAIIVTSQHTFHLKETDEQPVGVGPGEKISLIWALSSLSFTWHKPRSPSVTLPARIQGLLEMILTVTDGSLSVHSFPY